MSTSVQGYLDISEPDRHRRVWWAVATVLVIGAAIAIVVPLFLYAKPVQVVRRDVIASVALSGQATAPPSAGVEIRMAQPASVARVDVVVGQRVNRGDRLVELYYPSVEQTRQQAEAELRAAQQSYAQVQSQYAAQLADARRALAAAQHTVRAARRQALAQALPPVPSSLQVTPEETLPPPPPPPPPPEPEAEPTPQTEPTVHLTAAGFDQGGFDTSDLQQALAQEKQASDQLVQTKITADQALAPYQQQVQQARAALEAARAGERAAIITAPISGTVLVLNAQAGQPAGTNNSVVATIVDLTAVSVQAPVAADQAPRLRVGLPATVTFTAVPGQQFSGHIARLVAQPAPRGQRPPFVAQIDFENDDGLVKPGMQAQVAVDLGQAHDVLAVPNSAVRTDREGQTFVTVKRGEDWMTRYVHAGLQGNAYTEIRSGLREGDIVRG